LNKDSKIIIGAVGGLIILSLLIMVAVFAAGTFVGSDTAKVDIDTNGTNTTIDTYSSSWFNDPPTQMKNEIQQYTTNAIYNDPNSTVDSIKSEVTVIANKYNYTNVDVTLKSQFGENQLVMAPTVSGDSMYPTLTDGQRIVVLKTKNFKVGDIVIAKYPEVGLIVKRVSIIEANRVYLISDNTQVTNIVNASGTFVESGLKTWVPRGDVIGVVKVY
jgi:phage repressor protein C with HTH and peptisase S24 domain